MVEDDDKIGLYSYKVQSTITSRLANTMIQAKMVNNAKRSQHIVFDVQVPKGAFIDNFTMDVNGITFTSKIREKSEARKMYSQAKAKGKAAGIVRRQWLDVGTENETSTNINEALLRATFILNEAQNLGMLDPNSVSMIVLVSDGDPTVGELKLTTIQKNVKQSIKDEFSLFCLGIGFDVDYDFLQRIATDNRGMAQRIFGNQETSAQMKNFYNQVSTPLLKKIQFNYPQESVSDVTQSSFHNYFGGSEIVVAGKVDTENLQHLESIVTATAANAELVMETLRDVEELDGFMKKDKYADPEFTKKLWAYLTVNQMLAERNTAPTAALKRNITKSILQMSLDHHIVTPFTAMLIENAEKDEIMLADQPKDPRRGCCPGTLGLTPNAPNNNKGIPAWANATAVPVSFMPEQRSPPVSSLSINRGVVVNGQLVGAKKTENKKLNTYFGKIGLYFKNKGLKVEITTKAITLKDGSYSITLSWSDTGHIIRKQ
ncbi:hypothetical protein llap_17532 [Limosa lapponica baueri]|uniref:VWFA domain-containing protein n=1 Tax=Limosa lapponica baueri TaxID=1758121 RepID=A0A2I0TED8_LIMLA|nr:hypothetical protein llap_17532 [Limosa lapponica baueri]